ncbi:MAG: vitamin K epoxide reductase family protein [Anaerolineales bacterium]|nr:vitamin K epoxide reductase family protein [Anaerolineales bacterium]
MRTQLHPSASLLEALRARPLWAAGLVLSVVGLVNAGYLSWTRLFNTTIYCGPGSSACDAVSNSVYGYLLGIPVAYLGFLSYAVLLGLLLLEHRVDFFKVNGLVLTFGLTLFGTLFSGYLQYASIFRLREVCPYCVLNAVTMVALFVVTVLRLRSIWQADDGDA